MPLKDPAARRAYNKAWYSRNREKSRAKSAAYREAHKDTINAYKHDYYMSHKEESADYGKRWRVKNKEKLVSYNKAYWRENRERLLAYHKDYYATHKEERRAYKSSPRVRLSAYKSDAARDGRIWDLPDPFALALLEGIPCHYGHTAHISYGIDRIDSRIGYTPGNVVPCCWTHNRMKSNLTQREFKAALAL